jgi:hypothetical protein
MKLNKRQIGKIQICLGVLLILATIIGAYFVMTILFYQKNLATGASVMSEYWGEDAQQYDSLNLEIQAHSITGLILLSEIYNIGSYIFYLGCIIMIVLSFILILQGLANQK